MVLLYVVDYVKRNLLKPNNIPEWVSYTISDTLRCGAADNNVLCNLSVFTHNQAFQCYVLLFREPGHAVICDLTPYFIPYIFLYNTEWTILPLFLSTIPTGR